MTVCEPRREGAQKDRGAGLDRPIPSLEQFPDLTAAEKKLLHAVTAGEIADYSRPNDAENNPQHADTWDELSTIHAKVIRWLCVDREAILQCCGLMNRTP